ncbi:sensor histidine kinase, partial [Candidatus Omnitrophota bacterium]
KLKDSSPSQEIVDLSVKYLEMVEKESKRCQWIISNLLNFSRKPTDEMEGVSLKDVVDSTVSMLEYQLSQKNVRVEAVFPPEGLKPVKGNANQLQQVFTNLVQNAQDAMLSGGKIKIVGENKQDKKYRPPFEYVEVRVSDAGSGISKESIDKIFDPFYTSKVGKSGTGLGLSITHTIVSNHRGTIKVESEEGKGTTFVISIPALKEDKKNKS